MGERSLVTVSDAEFEAIEAAVMETARGRWFLAEYAKRNRTADTRMLLDAIGRLEQAVASERTVQGMDRLRFDLTEMAKAISRAKHEVVALRPEGQEQSQHMPVSEALDGIVRTTERATSDILEAAEHVQEAAWTLREDGADPQHCDELDRRATEIYTACSFQDLTAQRTGKIIQTLRYLEGRINAMIDTWGGEYDEAADDNGRFPAPVPDPIAADLTQSDVDVVIVDGELFPGRAAAPERPDAAAEFASFASVPVSDDLFEPSDDEPEGTVVLHPVEAARQTGTTGPNPEAFADIDALDTREKLRRFT